MNPDRWQLVQDLLAESLERTPEERGAFLSARCGDDVELRDEVVSLLEASQRADEYFDDLGERAGVRRTDAGEGDVTNAPDDSLLGRTVSHFKVTDFLGQGGMGKVYRATDSELNRDVALKVLSDHLAGSPQQAARLKREAQALAALNHPHIASIYGLENIDGHLALVLELVEGRSLAEVLKLTRGGALRVNDALGIARQVAAAVEAAHAKGIVHRDLKPANIIISADNEAKVLDFGIAKALQPEIDVQGNPEWSPTEVMAATQPGRIMGTVAYMSPEQARGKPVDGRTDVWAFGCVLYEMLTGNKAFAGDTATDTIAAIIEREPDWDALPAALPAQIVALIRRCLRKDPKRRLRSIGDAWLEIDDVLERPIVDGPAQTGRLSVTRRALPWAAALIVGVVGLWVGLNLGGPPRAPTRRLEIAVLGEDLRSALGGRALALSPAGDVLVYTAPTGLNQRPLDEFESQPIADTFGAESPFFSADGEWVGFFARGRLRKVSLRGGSSFELCDATTPRGAHWSDDETIVFSDGTSLWRVDSGGRECTLIATPDQAAGEVRYEWPTVLPSGTHVMFELVRESSSSLSVIELASGAITTVTDGGSDGHYLPSGHIVYSRAGTLLALPFDVSRMQPTGDPVPVLEGVRSESTGASQIAFSADGAIAYAPTTDPSYRLVWVDRNGTVEPVSETPGDFTTPRVSPNGRLVALAERRAGELHIWVRDLDLDTAQRITSVGSNNWPDWTPDSARVVFSSGRGGPSSIWWKLASGAGEARQLARTAGVQYAVSVADRVPVAAFFQVDASGTRDIWVLPLDGQAEPIPLITTPAHEQGPALSPDATRIAFVSNDSGRNEVYVQRCLPCSGIDETAADIDRRQVSFDGGGEPVWHPGGNELFYREGNRMMSVRFDVEAGFRPSRPVEVFTGAFAPGQSGNRGYDVAPDGERFLMLQGAGPDPLRPRINVVLNWINELEAAFER